MINLLPKSFQRKLDEERNFKITTMLAIVTVAALLSFALMVGLLQVYYWERSKTEDIAVIEKEQEAKIFNIEASEKMITDSNDTVSKLKKIYSQQTRVGDIFRQVALALPAGVTLESFSYTSQKIGLTGYAASRESLAGFKSNLERQKEFKSIFFPPESWIDEKNIKFTVNFSYGI